MIYVSVNWKGGSLDTSRNFIAELVVYSALKDSFHWDLMAGII